MSADAISAWKRARSSSRFKSKTTERLPRLYCQKNNERSGSGGIDLARERALELLHESIALAKDLPLGAGVPLQDLAKRFAARL